MALNEVIRTAGDIRRVIAQTMVDVRAGTLTVDKGMCVAALAKEVTASMQAEVNVAKVRVSMLASGSDLGKVTHMGKLLIDDDSTPTLSGASD